jgi:hypothetical protein
MRILIWKDSKGVYQNRGFLGDATAIRGNAFVAEITDATEIAAAIATHEAEQAKLAYRARRAAEYPPLADLADALIHKASSDPAEIATGEEQERVYYTACRAIKAKYPKP